MTKDIVAFNAITGDVQLLNYEAALVAIKKAVQFDDLKKITNKADAMRAAARIAGNTEAEMEMAEIRIRAERRVGQLMAMTKEAGMLSKGGRPKKADKGITPLDAPITLEEVGIGKMMANRARKLAGLPEEKFETTLTDWKAKITDEGARVTHTLIRNDGKRVSRAEKMGKLMERIRASAGQIADMVPVPVIMGDPPWRYEVRSENGMDRSADNHYPTLTTDEIIELLLKLKLPDQGVFFLWATVPMLLDAIRVMEAIGFTYKSHCVWVKLRPGEASGTGYWFRNDHELLLVGTRGGFPAPEMGTQWSSVQEDDVGEHSEKPEKFYELVEAYYRDVPKLELFARADADGNPVVREGWTVIGAEADARA